MSSIIKRTVVILFAFSLIFFSSCAMDNDVPYIISDCYITIGEEAGFWKFSGITFDFYNKSNKQIYSMEIEGNLYQEKTANTFVNNRISQIYDMPINPSKSVKLRLPLDDYLSSTPKNSMKVDQFYIKKIVFSDGKTWTDPFGTYAQCIEVKNE